MATSNWNSVNDALPVKGKLVLAENRDAGIMGIARLVNSGWKNTDGLPFRGVTHWTYTDSQDET